MWFRFVIALGILVPATVLDPHRPWLHTFAIALAAFGAGRAIDGGIDSIGKPERRRSGIALVVIGIAVAGATLVVVSFPTLQRRYASHTTSMSTRPIDAAVPTPPIQRIGTWRAISLFNHTACGAHEDGTVACWGHVPIFSNDEVAEPSPVDGIAGATAIAVGFTSACALVDHHAWCFGWNYDESLGVPPTDTHDRRTTPVRVPIEASLIAIAAGGGHACALTDAGEAWCWGFNNVGQVGSAPTSDQDMRPPTRVAGVPPLRAIAAGMEASCAIARDDGRVWCWGDVALNGQIGAGARLKQSPAALEGLTGVTAIAMGDGQACIIERDASVACWGAGSMTLRIRAEVGAAAAIAVGEIDACSSSNYATSCWGWLHAEPAAAVSGVPPLTALVTGELESCGLTATGALWCWNHRSRRGLLER